MFRTTPFLSIRVYPSSCLTHLYTMINTLHPIAVHGGHHIHTLRVTHGPTSMAAHFNTLLSETMVLHIDTTLSLSLSLTHSHTHTHTPFIRQWSYPIHHHLDTGSIDNILQSFCNSLLFSKQLRMLLVELESHQAIFIPC